MAPKKAPVAKFAPKDMVLAKMTGFPAWPSFVMPPEMIPAAIMKAKKKTTNMCVIFIPDGDFNWMNEKSLEPLSAEKLSLKISKIPKDKLKPRPKSKSGRTSNVAEALVAAENLNFDDFMDELNKAMQVSDEEDINDEIEEGDVEEEGENEHEENEEGENGDGEGENGEGEAEEKEEGAENSDKDNMDENKKQEENGIVNDGDKSIDDGPEAGNGKPNPQGRKQRRSDSTKVPDEPADEAVEDAMEHNDKPGRRKRRTRPDTLQPKRARNDRSEAKHEAKANGRAAGKHAEPKVTELDALPAKASESPKAMSEKDRQHQLWLCRIKLQRSLIQRNQPVTPKDPKLFPAPTVDELLVARIILNRLADFPVSVELLKETKIHKVLRCILKYEDLEYPDSFRLHEKCEELLDKWLDLIESLKQEKQTQSRVSSLAPEDAEASAIDVKKDLEKVEV